MPTMKKYLLIAGIALSSLAGLSKVHAQFVPNQTNAALGDLILGFETTGGGGAANLVVDLGGIATNGVITNSSGIIENFLANPLNLSNDLTTVFGSNWSNTVSYGLYSVNLPKQIFASAPASQSTGYLEASSSTQGVQKTAFLNLLQLFKNNGVSGLTTANGVIETASTTYSWSYFTPSSAAFGNANYANIEVPIGSAVNMFLMVPNNTGALGSLLANNSQFQVSSNGVFSAVPEPSAYGLMSLGAMALGFVALRRRAKA
jgi:PEP-CTERM motif